jgi:RNA polymerase sigma-70 factor, ECF subfamily
MNQLVVMAPRPHESRGDAELVKSVIDGDEAALRVIWNRYVTSVRSTLRACMGKDHTIDDLTQEVFIAFFKSAARLRTPGSLRPYLLGTATRLALFELRSRTRRNRWHRLFHFSVDETDAFCLPDVDERDALRALNHVLQSMPDRECQAFVLRYVQDLSPNDVAVALKIPKGSAKRAISRGRKLVLKTAKKESALTDYLRRCREPE